MRQYYPTLTLWYACDSLYITKGLAMPEIKKYLTNMVWTLITTNTDLGKAAK